MKKIILLISTSSVSVKQDVKYAIINGTNECLIEALAIETNLRRERNSFIY